MKHTSILICGAGPSGLSLSLALSRMGIKHILVDQRLSPSAHPKAKALNVRTMELFKLWEVEKNIRAHELPPDKHRYIWVESLHGKIIAENKINTSLLDDSPTTSCFASQRDVEHELIQAILKYKIGDLQFGKKLSFVHQTDDFVACELIDKDTNLTEIIHCEYLIAADGAKSNLRKTLDVEMARKHELGTNLSVYCKIDLSPWIQDKLATVIAFTDKNKLTKMIVADDHQLQWVFTQRLNDPNIKIDHEYCVNLIKSIIDMQDVPLEIVKAAQWEMVAANSANYNYGRVFLIGDAAHQLPPFGGMGLNLGVQDAHNLAWKLAYVIQGIASSQLLNTYYTERSPVVNYIIDWSLKNTLRLKNLFQSLMTDNQDAFVSQVKLQRQQTDHRGLDLGYIYNTEYLYSNINTYEPSGKIGARAPHCYVTFRSKKISILELFEKNYVLLLASENLKADVLSNLPIPSTYALTVYIINQDVYVDSERFFQLYELSTVGAILIRPDGHIAWKYNSG